MSSRRRSPSRFAWSCAALVVVLPLAGCGGAVIGPALRIAVGVAAGIAAHEEIREYREQRAQDRVDNSYPYSAPATYEDHGR